MKNKVMLIVLTAIVTLLLSACGADKVATNSNEGGSANGGGETTAAAAPEEASELTIKHQLGETKVKKNPAKVVVFDFGVLDTLDKLGVEVTGIPQASIPKYLSKYGEANYKNVGSLKEPDFEALSGIAPDLIIISGRQSEQYEELSKIGPTVFMGVDNAKFLESYKENVTTLGQIFGKEELAASELAKTVETIDSVKAEATASGKNALIVLVTGGKISAYGAGSRFGIIHDVLGVPAVDPKIEVSTHGMSVSFEYILEKDPDYLFVIDRDAAIAAEGTTPAASVVENELVKKTKAFKNNHIIYLDPDYWYLSGGGLISVSEMVKQVETAVKP
jgi:iron complex transport system substrate-binding protein